MSLSVLLRSTAGLFFLAPRNDLFRFFLSLERAHFRNSYTGNVSHHGPLCYDGAGSADADDRRSDRQRSFVWIRYQNGGYVLPSHPVRSPSSISTLYHAEPRGQTVSTPEDVPVHEARLRRQRPDRFLLTVPGSSGSATTVAAVPAVVPRCW